MFRILEQLEGKNTGSYQNSLRYHIKVIWWMNVIWIKRLDQESKCESSYFDQLQ